MPTCTFLNRYKILNKIGEGSFSDVLKCLDMETGIYVAIKRIKKRYNSWDEVMALAEVIAWQKVLPHPNILAMHECHYEANVGKVTLLFELMDMSLYDFMNSRKRCIPEPRAKHYLYQMLSGLEHLHNSGLFHRDIKPENILIKIPLSDEPSAIKYEIIKLGDLGSVRGIYSKQPYTEYISTRWYRSPECLLTQGFYDFKMDIWAVGCVFYEMLNFKPLFPGVNEVDQLSKIHQVLGTPSNRIISKLMQHKSCNWEGFPKQIGSGLTCLMSTLSTDGQSIMKLMITYDPDMRVRVGRLLEHKYFAGIRAVADKTDKTQERLVSFRGPNGIQIKKGLSKKSTNRYMTDIFTSTTENNIICCRRHDATTTYNSAPKLLTTGDPKSQLLKKTTKTAKNTFENYSDIMRGMECKTKTSISSRNTCRPRIMNNESEKKIEKSPDRKKRIADIHSGKDPITSKRRPVDKNITGIEHAKTTSVLHSDTKTNKDKQKQPQHKSFVLPHNYSKRLDSIPEAPIESVYKNKKAKVYHVDHAKNISNLKINSNDKQVERYVIVEKQLKKLFMPDNNDPTSYSKQFSVRRKN